METSLKENLQRYMEERVERGIVVAFSGGVDSSLLLQAACLAREKRGGMVCALTVHTRLHPAGDVETAARVAAQMGAEHAVLSIDEMEGADLEDNPPDRCYRCKKFLFQKILEEARKRHAATVVEGTNQDDLSVYRPGIRAVRELGIESPLARLGFTKAQVRRLAKEYGISVSDRPAAPCLATRFPYGTRLSGQAMARVDEGEQFLRSLGLYNVRIRVHGDIARVEVDAEAFPRVLAQRTQIVRRLKTLGFPYVTLDLEGFRSGSMDIGLV